MVTTSCFHAVYCTHTWWGWWIWLINIVYFTDYFLQFLTCFLMINLWDFKRCTSSSLFHFLYCRKVIHMLNWIGFWYISTWVVIGWIARANLSAHLVRLRYGTFLLQLCGCRIRSRGVLLRTKSTLCCGIKPFNFCRLKWSVSFQFGLCIILTFHTILFH